MSSTLFHISAGEQIISQPTFSKFAPIVFLELIFFILVFICSSVSVTLAQYHSICLQTDHCRIPAFQMVDVALITVYLNVNVVLVHFVDWPNNLNRLWCRAAKLLTRLINAWKWPKQSSVHYKKHAAN